LPIVDDKEFNNLCARINGALDTRAVIDLLGYHPDKAIRSGNLWRMYCPVHKDTIFRTLVLNPRRNTCHCEYSACEAHRPTDYIELIARARKTTRTKAVRFIIEHFGTDHLKLSEQQMETLKHFLSTAETGS